MKEEIFKKYKIKAKKTLGQNFLVNKEIVKDISNILEIYWKNIVEVWPGYWALTEKLLEKKPKNLKLIELDSDMINILEDRIENWDLDISNTDFEIKNVDILKYIPDFQEYFVIANIPYYITSPILRHFLYNIKNNPEKMLILMQKDVWDKIILGQQNSKKNKSSVLSLFIAKKYFVKEVIFVWKQNFVPVPKVESSVLLFEINNQYNDIDDNKFLEVIKKWFLEPRKKLIKNLEKSWYKKEKILEIYKKLSLSENIRWDSLSIDIWCKIIKQI